MEPTGEQDMQRYDGPQTRSKSKLVVEGLKAGESIIRKPLPSRRSSTDEEKESGSDDRISEMQQQTDLPSDISGSSQNNGCSRDPTSSSINIVGKKGKKRGRPQKHEARDAPLAKGSSDANVNLGRTEKRRPGRPRKYQTRDAPVKGSSDANVAKDTPHNGNQSSLDNTDLVLEDLDERVGPVDTILDFDDDGMGDDFYSAGLDVPPDDLSTVYLPLLF